MLRMLRALDPFLSPPSASVTVAAAPSFYCTVSFFQLPLYLYFTHAWSGQDLAELDADDVAALPLKKIQSRAFCKKFAPAAASPVCRLAPYISLSTQVIHLLSNQSIFSPINPSSLCFVSAPAQQRPRSRATPD